MSFVRGTRKVFKAKRSDTLAAGIPIVMSWPVHAMAMMLLLVNIAILRIDVVANLLGEILNFLPILDPHEIEPLSFADWMVHMPLMPIGVELCGTLWYNHKTPFAKNLAALFGLGFVQGWFAIMDHSLVGVNTDLQQKLWSISYWALNASIFMTGVVGWAPNKWGWGLASLVGCGIWTHHIGLKNAWGGILSTSAMMAILARKDLSYFFKGSYILLAMAPVAVPGSSTDEGHTAGAAYVASALCLLLVSARKMVPMDLVATRRQAD